MPLDKPPFSARPAQPPGKTYLQYSPDGKRLLVAGCAFFVRSFNTGDNGEPDMVDDTPGDSLAVATGNDYCIIGCEDGTVTQWKLPEGPMDRMLTRCTLPIRDIALSPDENWLAVCSDEIEVKIVNRHDIEQIMFLRDPPRPVKHLTYDPTGTYLAASCTDGIIYIYDVSSAEPYLLRTIDGIIPRLETTDDATSRCVWHPDGRAFACATATRDINIISVADGERQRSFSGGHMGDITSLSWTPNGAMLASSSKDDLLVVWETKTQKVLKKFNYEKIINITWQNHGLNLFNWTTSWGECYIIPNFLQDPMHVALLNGPHVHAPYFHDPLDDKTAVTNGRRAVINRLSKLRVDSPDSLDHFLGTPDADDLEWIEEDDDRGYTNENHKRTNAHLGEAIGHVDKRGRPQSAFWQPLIHESFQPAATPWRGNRKYLCLNLVGFVWTVDQDTHNTITVEFYDHDLHRDFHFTDPFLYDKACLNEDGTLFACSGSAEQPSKIMYRPHETWTTGKSDWRINLPPGEDATCIALSTRYIVAMTSVGYARVWTLFGTPVRIWRMKSLPAVSCVAWGDYVMTVGNGAVGSDGCAQLTYNIENIQKDETYQNEDLVALGASEDVSLKNLFWSEEGDPWIYDSTGTLLCCLHWRMNGKAKWVPMLETKSLDRLRGGRKEESYWPVAVAREKFHCIILKGGDQHPYFPKPLLSEFDLQVPVNSLPNRDKETGDESNLHVGLRLEESFVRKSILLTLLDDFVAAQRGGSWTHKSEAAGREIEVDKTLLQLIAVECREGEERQMKALDIVYLMRDTDGKMIDAASKVAARFGRTILQEKIREVGERRLQGIK